jgi:aryl-alcohol dehydrogenase-like predicted oxidoreductase
MSEMQNVKLFPCFCDQNVGMLIWSPLSGGLLTQNTREMGKRRRKIEYFPPSTALLKKELKMF